MKKVLSGLMALVVLSSFAHADDGVAIQNVETYGNCQAWESVDLLTDIRRYHFWCFKREEQDTFRGKVQRITAAVRVNSYREEGKDYLRPQVWIRRASRPFGSTTIPVKIRVDKGALIQGGWSWDKKEKEAFVGGAQGHNFSFGFLERLFHGKSIIIQAGDKRKQIELKGVQQAVQDFRQRIRSMQWAGGPNL